MSETEEPDLWINVSTPEFVGALAWYFNEVEGLIRPPGRVLLPTQHVSVGSVLVNDLLAENVGDASPTDPIDDQDLIPFTVGAPEWIVKCCIWSGMPGQLWGLKRFQLQDRCYVYHQANSGYGDDESLPILSAWEPAEDTEAFRICFLETYAQAWDKIGLPPYMGEYAAGPPDLMQEAIIRALRSNPDFWEQTIGYFADNGGVSALSEYLGPEEIAEDSNASLEAIRKVWTDLQQPEDVVSRAARGNLTVEEQAAFVAVFWKSIEADPFGDLETYRDEILGSLDGTPDEE